MTADLAVGYDAETVMFFSFVFGVPNGNERYVSETETLLRTPLTDLHQKLGARMVPFAGYNMPVQYADGVMKEHLHTRTAAGLFDVSHMGQVVLRAKSGDVADAARALERLVPVGVLGLSVDRQRYAFFTNDEGGVLDDLMIANRGDHLFLVINAACKNADVRHLKDHLSQDCEIEELKDRALLALQGPKAEAALAALAPVVADMRFMDVRNVEIVGAECFVSRSGYTCEDGYEISVPASQAVPLAEALLANADVKPIGLGARDSLRLEGGLCLYGNDIDTSTTPVEANLNWAIQKVRRKDGARSGGFPGADLILQQLQDGAKRLRVGLQPEGRAPMRAGTQLYLDEKSDEAIGSVTSGGFGPSVAAPIAMGYVSAGIATAGTKLFGEVRGKRLPVQVVDLPFITPNFKRR